MRVVASLLAVVTSQTAQGGQVVGYTQLGRIWLKLGARRRREKTEEGISRTVESLSAVAREDERLEVGQVVRFGRADWDVKGLEPEGLGRMKLGLERRQ